MKIRHFRNAANQGVHKHGILHVWRWNAFPWRSPWRSRHCGLQKPGKFPTKKNILRKRKSYNVFMYFWDFLHSNPSHIGDFQILVISNLDFSDFNFDDVLLGPKHHQNRGITVLV